MESNINNAICHDVDVDLELLDVEDAGEVTFKSGFVMAKSI